MKLTTNCFWTSLLHCKFQNKPPTKCLSTKSGVKCSFRYLCCLIIKFQQMWIFDLVYKNIMECWVLKKDQHYQGKIFTHIFRVTLRDVAAKTAVQCFLHVLVTAVGNSSVIFDFDFCCWQLRVEKSSSTFLIFDSSLVVDRFIHVMKLLKGILDLRHCKLFCNHLVTYSKC